MLASRKPGKCVAGIPGRARNGLLEEPLRFRVRVRNDFVQFCFPCPGFYCFERVQHGRALDVQHSLFFPVGVFEAGVFSKVSRTGGRALGKGRKREGQ